MKAEVVLLLAFLCAPMPAQDRWTELGPAPITTGPYTGRIAALAASKTNANLYYVGGADGGVWRTDNGGTTWTPVGDMLPVTAVGAMAIDPANDQILYVGTGEANYANHSRYGVGLAKTLDGGATWSIWGVEAFAGRTFHRLLIDPADSNTLYAAIGHAGGFPLKTAGRNHPLVNGHLGVYKSTDAGESWTPLAGGLPTDTVASDVAVTEDAAGTVIIYAAVGDIFGTPQNGVYKSTDGGATFTKLGGGLPTTNVGRITLAVAPSDSDRVYASVVNPSSSTGGGSSTHGVFRSDDAGVSWSSIGPGNYQASYGWYLSTSIVHPTDPNTVFVGGLTCRRTQDGGSTWVSVTPPHVDLHAFDWDASGRLLVGDDGGIHRTTDLGVTWTSLNNNLGLIQFYAGISIDPNFAGRVYGGTQDNGTNVRVSGTNWTRIFGGDGGYTSLDSTGTRLFIEYQGTGNLFRSISGGAFVKVSTGISGRNCFLPPHEIFPTNSMLMIYGTEVVFQSVDGGNNWRPISPDLAGGVGAINGLAFAPSDQNTIYVGTNTGNIQVTQNGGLTWDLRLSGLFTWPRNRHQFAVHPTDPQKAYLAVGAFGTDQIRYTTDAGATWTSLDGDLPDLPAHAVALDFQDGDPPILYLGTDRGVHRSTDHGVHWERYGYDTLPNAPAIDIRVDSSNNRLLAATQGRGLWQIRLTKRDEVLRSGTVK